MRPKFVISSLAALAFIVLAAGGDEASAASNGTGSNGRGYSGPGSNGPGIHSLILHRAPTMVHAWLPQRRRELPNNCELQKWKHWDGEAYYYRVLTFCRGR